MSPRLPDNALSRVNEHDRDVGGRRRRRHVAGVLLVAGRVGDNESPPTRGEVPISYVDCDALLAFGKQPVDQEREVDFVATGAEPAGIGLKRCPLVGEDAASLEKESPNKCRLAVVNAAANDEPKRRLYQKYPSRFFFSIDAGWSESISRPWRSDTPAAATSAMISATVRALLSTAPDSG